MITEQAMFGAGCFWSTEAIFKRLIGVKDVTSGYVVVRTGDESKCSSSHRVEVVSLNYDAGKISYDELLSIFFEMHNPTLDHHLRPNYSSLILYYNDAQRNKAKSFIELLEKGDQYNKPVLTKVMPAVPFIKADDYHQNYFGVNKSKPYCTLTIQPKLDRLVNKFVEKFNAQLL